MSIISIHAPREGGDYIIKQGWTEIQIFQSTPPARGATLPFVGQFAAFLISIHAPREGGDIAVGITILVHDISIHAPREGGD